jgi:hypothetical protein
MNVFCSALFCSVLLCCVVLFCCSVLFCSVLFCSVLFLPGVQLKSVLDAERKGELQPFDAVDALDGEQVPWEEVTAREAAATHHAAM